MKALVIVDVQNDFCPGGALAVREGDRVVEVINRVLSGFDLVVATQDWHPAGHSSFAANHPGRRPGERIELAGLPQVLWPVHCVENTPGADLHPGLDRSRIARVFRKGMDRSVDSYSGFFDNGHRAATGLGDYLKGQGVTDVYVCGLATDYCVKFTALDAVALGFHVWIIEDACRGVELQPGDIRRAIDEMRASGVNLVHSNDLGASRLPHDQRDRIERMQLSLDGLSIGDGFGAEIGFQAENITDRELTEAPWYWTDDTEMALSIASILFRYGRIDQDELARSFAEHFDPSRRYGPAMYQEFFPRVRRGENWRIVAKSLFGGSGSLGNGSAMRVAPLGAYFADRPERLTEAAAQSAEVTHAHPEGIAGAIAVATAAAHAWMTRTLPPQKPRDFLAPILAEVPESKVRHGIALACRLPPDIPPRKAAEILGNGSRVTAMDTVPLALWLAARFLGNYEEALWNTAGVYGDMDTNCAIVGGIVALHVGRDGLPSQWLLRREPLPAWPFERENRT